MFSNSKEVRMEVMSMDNQGGEGYHREQEVSEELWKQKDTPISGHVLRETGDRISIEYVWTFWHPRPAIRTHPIDKHFHRCLICANVGVAMSTELLEIKTNLSRHTVSNLVFLDIYPPQHICVTHIHTHTPRTGEIIDTKSHI